MKIIHKIKRYYRIAYKLGHYPSMLSVLTTKSKIIMYYGFLGDKNFGDEVVYESAKHLFKPNILIPVKKKMPIPFIIFCKFFNSRISGIIIGGGTLFGGMMEQDFFESLVSSEKPVYVHGTGAHEVMRSLDGWRRILNKKVYGGVRGPISVLNMTKYGFYMDIAGDAAFSMFDIDINNNQNERESLKKILVNMGTHVAYDGSAKSRQVLKEFIKICLIEGYKIQFLPFFCIDLKLGLELQSEMPEMEILNIPTTYLECVRYFHNSLFSIGERLHFSIMALLGNSPFLSINYDKKHEDFLISVDLTNSGIAPGDMSIEVVTKAFKNRLSFDWDMINEKIMVFKKFQFDQSSNFMN